MAQRALLSLVVAAPIGVLAAYQGMLTAGLLPLALFGPLYAVCRLAFERPGRARVESVRLTVAATLGAAFALLPALFFLGQGLDPVPSRLAGAGLGLTAAGLGVLAGLTTTPSPRPLSREEKRRWTLVEALDASHAKGLAVLFLIALPAAAGIALLREAPLFEVGGEMTTLPDALFGAMNAHGWLVLPAPEAVWVLVVPLSLAPVALGFLVSPKQATPFVGGGLLAGLAVPLVVWFGVPVATPDGAWIPLDLRPRPGFEALGALAPAGAGLVIGAGVVRVGRGFVGSWFVPSVLWASVGALVAGLLEGWVAGLVMLLGVVLAGVGMAWSSDRAPLGAALGVGALVGLVVGNMGEVAVGLAVGALVGIVVGGAVASSWTTRVLLLEKESIRGWGTLAYVGVGVVVAGGLVWLVSGAVGRGEAPFVAPHALGLAAALEALLTSRGDLLLVWGLLAGGLVQWGVGRGALVGLGFLVGPGVALLVLVGSLLRAAWEGSLLERAREGFVMRGELGYGLVRAHALVVAVLAGEGLAVGLAVLAWG